MTLVSSGVISISNISVELGEASTTTHSLNDASFRNLAGVASGAISMSNFYGKANAFTASVSITSNTTDYNIRSAAIAAGWNQVLKLVFTVNVGGIYVGASSTGAYAMQTGASFPAGSTLSLINGGVIIGYGGKGGNGGTGGALSAANGGAGNAAGPGFLASAAISITNNNWIASGGGGGGGGGGDNRKCSGSVVGGGGSGGGGGRGVSAGGSGGTTGCPGCNPANAGGAGTLTSAGGGGGSRCAGGAGGTGGDLGNVGSNGGSSASKGGGAGGSNNNAIVGNGNITWVAIGNRGGGIV